MYPFYYVLCIIVTLGKIKKLMNLKYKYIGNRYVLKFVLFSEIVYTFFFFFFILNLHYKILMFCNKRQFCLIQFINIKLLLITINVI